MTKILQGKSALITGASQGIGYETALGLARMGAKTIICGRDEERTKKAAINIKEISKNENISYLIADFASFKQIKNLAQQARKQLTSLDILVNNAGGMTKERKVTEDGFEMCWGLNHLSYFLLTDELLPLLRLSKGARIINVASSAHKRGIIDFDDLQSEKKYKMWKAYGQSKLANIMFSYSLARHLSNINISVNCLHPGVVATGFVKNISPFYQRIDSLLRPFFISAKEGAKTPIFLASSSEVENISGKYFYKLKQIKSSPLSYDIEIQQRLWEISKQQTGAEYILM